jgi:hypothetical protein
MSDRINTVELYRLWTSQERKEDICRLLGVTREGLYRLQKQHKLPHRNPIRLGTKKYADPTPDEIAERTAEVRSRWTPEEWARRCVCREQGVQFRSFAYDGRQCAFITQDTPPI